MTAGIVRGHIYSFDATTWTAVVQLAGSVGESVLPVLETVSSGQLADGDQVAVLLFDLNNPNNGVVLGPFGSTGGSYNTPPIINQPPTNGEVPIGRTSDGALVLAALTGTANQITVTGGAGSITLSTPQNLHTGASPTFAGLTVSALTSGRVVLASTSGLLADDADLAFNGAQLALATQGSTGGILIGGDAQLYRSAADLLRTPDSLTVDAGLNVGSAASAATGQVRASAGFLPDGDNNRRLLSRTTTLADDGTEQVVADTAYPYAWIFIRDTTDGASAILHTRGGIATAHIIFDVAGLWRASDTDTFHCIYHSGSAMVLKNRRGAARTYHIQILLTG